jgi:hypothetical protein
LVTLDGVAMSPADWKTTIAVPSVGKSHEAGEIGTAFDYVARAILTRKVGTTNVEDRRPIAQGGLARLLEVLHLNAANEGLYAAKDPIVREQRQEGVQLALEHESELLDYLERRLDAAISAKDEFIGGKLSMEDYAAHTLFMARLDAVFRPGTVGVVDGYFALKGRQGLFCAKPNRQRRRVAWQCRAVG